MSSDLVERLGVYADYVEYDPPLNYEDAAATTMREAVCTIRALVAANSVLAAAHNDTLAKLREAVEVMWTLYHAACGPTGFAAAVRATSGVPYPWPALDDADDLARAFLASIDAERATMEKREDSTSE